MLVLIPFGIPAFLLRKFWFSAIFI